MNILNPSEKSNVQLIQNLTPLEQAKLKTKGILQMNETTIIDAWGQVGAKKAMYVCMPMEQGNDQLRKCYRIFFQTVLDANLTEVLFPALNIEENGFEPVTAAMIAVTEAAQFRSSIGIRKICEIKFVCPSQDVVNIAAFLDAKKRCRSLFKPPILKRIHIVDGKILKLSGDILVVPMQTNYSNPGAICNALEKATRKFLKYIPPEKCQMTLLPLDLLQLIFSKCTIKDLGRLEAVCKSFMAIQNNSEVIWNVIAERLGMNLIPDKNITIKSQVQLRTLKGNYSEE